MQENSSLLAMRVEEVQVTAVETREMARRIE
jgi:hypothetical protein